METDDLKRPPGRYFAILAYLCFVSTVFERTSPIEKVDSGQYHCTLRLNSGHVIFKAHFPGFPVLPGVVLLHAFNELASEVLFKNIRLKNAGNVKFLHPVTPQKYDSLDFSFTIVNEDDGYSLSGVVSGFDKVVAKAENLKYLPAE